MEREKKTIAMRRTTATRTDIKNMQEDEDGMHKGNERGNEKG